MKKLILIAMAMFVSALAFNASAQYAYPQYASANEYRPLSPNEVVILTQDDVDALDAQGAIDWNLGDISRKGTHLAQTRTVLNKKGKEVEKKVKFTKEEQTAILSDVGGLDLNPVWKKYSVMRNTGMYMLIGGSLFMIGGAAAGGGLVLAGIVVMPLVVALVTVFSFGLADPGEIWDNVWSGIMKEALPGGIVAVAGTATAVTGLVLLCVGNRHLNRVVKYTNAVGKPMEANVSFGATSNGIGLTFNF